MSLNSPPQSLSLRVLEDTMHDARPAKERVRRRLDHEPAQIHFALHVAVLMSAGHNQTTTARLLGVPAAVLRDARDRLQEAVDRPS